MRVLWFSVTGSLYNKTRNAHNGGGWIESLEHIVKRHNEIELGISFVDNSSTTDKAIIDGVTYYPQKVKFSFLERIKCSVTSESEDKIITKNSLHIIDDFHPDIIHIFGAEWCFGLIKQYTKVPIVIHIQGSLPPYNNAALPPGYSKTNDILRRWYNPLAILRYIIRSKCSLYAAKREELILKLNDAYMGRTRWDKALVNLYHPDARYFTCNEALRPSFTSSNQKWSLQTNNSFNIVTVGGGHRLKGYDTILKTAKILKDHNLNFKWKLCGASSTNIKDFEKMTHVYANEVNVEPLGRCSAEEVLEHLILSQLYVHAAYIDNSPNAICEAQYVGMPVVSTNVGGIPSLFSREYPQDMLVPTNDPYYLASKIIELSRNMSLLESMANDNFKLARTRHDEGNIYKELLCCYDQLINNK